MRKTEQRLWDRMRRALNGKARLERVENVVHVGTPDLLALVNGITTPIELKAVEDYPARATTRVLGDKGLSNDQRNWHKDWQKWGGRSLIAVGVGSRDLFIIPGKRADDVNEMTAMQLAEASVARDAVELLIVLGGSKL